jgi:hypothetical protein
MRSVRFFSGALVALGLAGNWGCSADRTPIPMRPDLEAGSAAPSAGMAGSVAGAAGMAAASTGGTGATAGMVAESPAGPGGDPLGGMGGAGGDPLGGAGGAGEIAAPMGPVLTARMALQQIAPGDQLTVCTTIYLDNPTEVKVKNVRGRISGGSHHFMVDRAPTDVPIPGLVPCVGLAGTDVTRVLIAEKPETIFAMPPGVGFTMGPNQALTTELHYFNPTDAPLDIEAVAEFELAEGEEAANMLEASMVFTGNPVIALLPRSPGVVEFYMPLAGSQELPARVFAMTSHTHALGVRSTIQMVDDPLAVSGRLVHESLSWAEPPMSEFNPPLLFTGTQGLLLRCEYENTRDVPVTFGTAVENEMCFMWLYYY